MIYWKRAEKTVQNLWNYYLLFRCCVIVIPIYIILIICGSYVMANNLEVPTIITTLYEFALLVFSAAIIFIIVLILATFGSDSNKSSVNELEYESEIFDSTNETPFDDMTLTNTEENLLTNLERATDQIELLLDNYSEFVVDLVSVDDTQNNHSISRYDYDLPPTYEEAIRTDDKHLINSNRIK